MEDPGKYKLTDALGGAGVTVPVWWQDFSQYVNGWLPPILLIITVIYFAGRALQVWLSIWRQRNSSEVFEEE